MDDDFIPVVPQLSLRTRDMNESAVMALALLFIPCFLVSTAANQFHIATFPNFSPQKFILLSMISAIYHWSLLKQEKKKKQSLLRSNQVSGAIKWILYVWQHHPNNIILDVMMQKKGGPCASCHHENARYWLFGCYFRFLLHFLCSLSSSSVFVVFIHSRLIQSNISEKRKPMF